MTSGRYTAASHPSLSLAVGRRSSMWIGSSLSGDTALLGIPSASSAEDLRASTRFGDNSVGTRTSRHIVRRIALVFICRPP